MQLTKPMPKRVAITARDPDGKNKSKSVTLYDTTPAEVIELMRSLAKQRDGVAATARK